MDITIEIPDKKNPTLLNTINVTKKSIEILNKFLTSGNLFSQILEDSSISLVCDYSGGSIHKYCFYIKDFNSGFTNIIDLKTKYGFTNDSPKISIFHPQIEVKYFGTNEYQTIFKNIDLKKLDEILFYRTKKLKKFSYDSGSFEYEKEITIKNVHYKNVPKVFFNHLTVNNFESLKNIPKNFDMDFFKFTESIPIKNIFKITAEEVEHIELFSDIKTPLYLKDNYQPFSHFSKLRKLLKL